MSPQRQIRFWLIGSAVFLACLYLLSSILLPFVAGLAIAYFLDPVADRLERVGFSRTVSVSLITLFVIMLMVLMLIGLVPLIQAQLASFAKGLPLYVDSLKEAVLPYVEELRALVYQARGDDLQASASQYVERAVGWIGTVLGEIVSGGIALINLASLLFITPIVAFYLLRDWDRMVALVDGYLPRHHAQTIRMLVREIDVTIASFVRGTGTVCILLGVFYAVGLSIVGLQLGVVIGLTAGLISFVPYLGSIVGLIASVGMALAQFSDWQPIAVVAAIFAVGQVIEGNVLTPRLVGGSVGLHPVWVIFAVLAGGTLFGFVGVLLGVPVAAIIGVLARFSLRQYLESPLYLGAEVTGRLPPDAPDPDDLVMAPSPAPNAADTPQITIDGDKKDQSAPDLPPPDSGSGGNR